MATPIPTRVLAATLILVFTGSARAGVPAAPDEAEARESLDVAMLVLDLDIKLATKVAEVRAQHHKRIASSRAELNQFREIDAKIVKSFRKLDGDLYRYARPHMDTVYACKTLNDDEMKPYRVMIDRMKRLRELATQTARITDADARRIDEAREESQRQFARHCVNAKLSYNEVLTRQKSILRELNALIED